MRLARPVVDGGDPVRLQRGDVRPGLLREARARPSRRGSARAAARTGAAARRALVEPGQLALAGDELLDLGARGRRLAPGAKRTLSATRRDRARRCARRRRGSA